MTQPVYLYGRAGCHLCAEMRDALAAWPALAVVEADVDDDPELVRRYGARVPVLVAPDGNEICHYFLDVEALKQHLDMP